MTHNMTSRDIELVIKLIKAVLEKSGIQVDIDTYFDPFTEDNYPGGFKSVIEEHYELVRYEDT